MDEQCILLTSDLWTSQGSDRSIQNRPFYPVKAGNFVQKTQLRGDSPANISPAICERDFKITKIGCLVTDNAEKMSNVA